MQETINDLLAISRTRIIDRMSEFVLEPTEDNRLSVIFAMDQYETLTHLKEKFKC